MLSFETFDNPYRNPDVLCGCGWGRLNMPEDEIPDFCPQCWAPIGIEGRELYENPGHNGVAPGFRFSGNESRVELIKKAFKAAFAAAKSASTPGHERLMYAQRAMWLSNMLDENHVPYAWSMQEKATALYRKLVSGLPKDFGGALADQSRALRSDPAFRAFQEEWLPEAGSGGWGYKNPDPMLPGSVGSDASLSGAVGSEASLPGRRGLKPHRTCASCKSVVPAAKHCPHCGSSDFHVEHFGDRRAVDSIFAPCPSCGSRMVIGSSSPCESCGGPPIESNPFLAVIGNPCPSCPRSPHGDYGRCARCTSANPGRCYFCRVGEGVYHAEYPGDAHIFFACADCRTDPKYRRFKFTSLKPSRLKADPRRGRLSSGNSDLLSHGDSDLLAVDFSDFKPRKPRRSRNPGPAPRISNAAVSKFNEFHGSDPNHVTVQRVNDGSRKTVKRHVMLIGSVPELHVVLRDGRLLRKRFSSMPKMLYEPKTKRIYIRGGSLGSFGKKSGMIGYCPELHYTRTPKGSNKGGKHWRHPCNPDDMPRVYWDAKARELIVKGGDLTVSDWLRSSTDP